jgi:hypothetical protein
LIVGRRQRQWNSVIEMTRARAARAAFLGREFDDFLFAPLDEGEGRMPLSVLSALARQGVDPWQEAAKLAQLPREEATQRLTAWIVTLPNGLSTDAEASATAIRLIALLPRGSATFDSVRGQAPADGSVANARPVVAFAVFIAFLIGVQFVLAIGQSSARVENATTPIATTVPSPIQAPISNR